MRDHNMGKIQRHWKVVSIVVLIPIVYAIGVIFLYEPINYFMDDWFFTWQGVLTVLGFDVIWIIIMVLCPLRSIKVKVVLTLFVLALSASVLTCWALLESLSSDIF